jgi:acetyl-CoA acyltransferase 2
MRRCALLNAVRTRLTRSPDYALRSQKRYAAALADGAFSAELTSVSLQTRKGLSLLVDDEHPRPQSTLESLASLRPVFIPSGGTVTAGNASGICDGAAVNIVMSESSLKRYNVRPLARIASYAWSACEPGIMGIGPVAATREALRKAGKSIGEMDLLEINEVNGAPAALGRHPPSAVD